MRPMEAFARPGVIASRTASGANRYLSATNKAAFKDILLSSPSISKRPYTEAFYLSIGKAWHKPMPQNLTVLLFIMFMV